MSDESVTSASPEVPFEGYDDLTVHEVVDRLRSADPNTIERVKAYERTRSNARRGIVNYEQPAPPPAEAPDGTERHLPDAWKAYGRSRFGVSPHAIAGALHDVTRPLSEDEVRARVDAFLADPAARGRS